MRFLPGLLACLLAALLPLGAQEMDEPEAAAPGGPPESKPYRIYLDFNNDEKKDLALSDASAWDTGGGTWQIYINRAPGEFQYAGQAFFHPLAFQVHGIKPGMGRIVACIRKDGGQADLVSYAVNDGAVTQTVSSSMKLGAFGDPDDMIKYDMLFGHLREMNFHIPFEPGDFEISESGLLVIDPPDMLDEMPHFVRLKGPHGGGG